MHYSLLSTAHLFAAALAGMTHPQGLPGQAPSAPAAATNPASAEADRPDEKKAAASPSPLFEDKLLRVAPEKGGEPQPVRTVCGSPEKNFILEVNGGGLVLGDFDGSGSTDLVVIDGSTLERATAGQPGRPSRLFLNGGRADFREADSKWSLPSARWAMGGAAGDVDADGDLDLFVTEWGADQLFLGDSGKGFKPAPKPGFKGKRWGTSAAFLDYDQDGQLDLAVVNYLAFYPDEVESRTTGACRWKGQNVMCGPEGLSPVHDQLYRGKGDGTFIEQSKQAGYYPLAAGFGLGITTLDVDADGDTDLYVTNDSTPNHLWINTEGKFEERGDRLGAALDNNGKEQAGMGIGVADVDGDGFQDVFATNFSGEPNAFYSSRKRRDSVRFRELGSSRGLAGPSIQYLGWGTGIYDFDLDGDLDLFTLNGHVYPQADAPGSDTSYAQPDHFYRNNGEGRFDQELLSNSAPYVSRAGTVADLDADGDLDIVALEIDGAVHLLMNRAAQAGGKSGHWLQLELKAQTKNVQALGATVTVEAGERRFVAEVRTAGGFQAAQPALVHFGLGDVEKLDRVRVRWPSGRESVHADVAVDQRHLISEQAK